MRPALSARSGVPVGGCTARSCLVVDDEADCAAVLAHHLTRLGYDTTVAATAATGQKCLVERAWDLVIVDVVLPDRDGRELISYIRALTPRPKIILTSVLGREDLTDQGADALLTKPFRGADVGAAVASARKAA